MDPQIGYACETEYGALYGREYHGHDDGAASFDREALPLNIHALIEARSLAGLVDIGGGNGFLARRLAERGQTTFTLDFNFPGDILGASINLSSHNPTEVEAAQAGIARTFAQGHYLTTCLDVLEHIDPAHIAQAMRTINALAGDVFVVSISTRPSSYANRYHCSVLPQQTWLKILARIGFQPAAEQPVFATPRIREIRLPADRRPATDDAVLHTWFSADVFGDYQVGEPWYVLLERSGPVELSPDFEIETERLLDIAYRRAKRADFPIEAIPRIALSVACPADFNILRSLLDVLPRSKVVVLLRRALFDTAKLGLNYEVLRAYFHRCGVETLHFSRLSELDWRGLEGAHLITTSESSVEAGHILSMQLVMEANRRGLRTTTLQHGIWVDIFPGRFAAFAGRSIVGWSDELPQALAAPVGTMCGQASARGVIEPSRYKALGGPRMAEFRYPQETNPLETRLGIDLARWKACILVGTNLQWPAHGVARADIVGRFATLFAGAPDTLFLLKIHPSESLEDYAALRRPNVLVLDDLLLLLMDVPLSRLLLGVDAVVSSLSTLLLDGALAGKPVIQYDTGHAYSYEGISPVPLEALDSVANLDRAGLAALPRAWDFLQRYAAGCLEHGLAEVADHLAADQLPATDGLAQLSIANTVDELLNYIPLVERAKADIQEQVGRYATLLTMRENEIDELRRYIRRIEIERDAAIFQAS